MRSRLGRVSGALVLAAILVACAPASSRCEELPLDPLLEVPAQGWELEFTPTRPCGGRQMRVTNVILDQPAGAPRISFVVAADGPVFLLGQSPRVRTFTQIPDGATRIEWRESGLRIVGFETMAGAGPAVVYLRWEVGGMVHEFQATPSRRFPAAALREIGRLNALRTLEAVDAAR